MISLPTLSHLIGWTYFICWSVSLYPVVFLNHRLQSVEGVSLDYLYLNGIGYLAYSASLSLLYFNEKVRNQYAVRHTVTTTGELNYPLVRINDVAYGVHGVFIICLTLLQVYCCGYSRGYKQRVSRLAKLIISAVTFGGLIFTAYAHKLNSYGKANYELVDFAMILGNVKILMSTAKYIPQVIHNKRRLSTKGFSIRSVQLDVTGASLALCQLFLDGYINNDIRGVLNNPVKLALSVVSINSKFCSFSINGVSR